MTGFAAVSRESADARVNVTAKSVNHRFLDVVVKAPQALAPVESRVRAIAQQKLARGRVDITIGAEVVSPPAREVVLDEQLLAQVVTVVAAARERGVVTGTLTASDLLRLPQVLEIRTKAENASSTLPASLIALVEETVAETMDALVTMRHTEGRLIGVDLDTRIATMTGFVDLLRQHAEEGQHALAARLRERLAGLPADIQLDAPALAQEIVRFVARSDVDEEIVRMRAHVEHWRALSAGPEPCGRKLDFLVQEMNREINTIGSKVEGAGGTEMVIAAKAELERIREQVQNVE